MHPNQSPSSPMYSSGPQAATGCPTLSPPPLALEFMLPPAQDCQIDHLGTLAVLAKPEQHQSLAKDTRGYQRLPASDSNTFQIRDTAIKKISMQASKHRFVRSHRLAAKAVAYKSATQPPWGPGGRGGRPERLDKAPTDYTKPPNTTQNPRNNIQRLKILDRTQKY